jgi:hypothetical protein
MSNNNDKMDDKLGALDKKKMKLSMANLSPHRLSGILMACIRWLLIPLLLVQIGFIVKVMLIVLPPTDMVTTMMAHGLWDKARMLAWVSAAASLLSIYAFVSAINCWAIDKEPLAMFRPGYVEPGRVEPVRMLFLGIRTLFILVVLAVLFSVMGGPAEFTYGLAIYLFTVLFISECVWAMLHNWVGNRYVKQGMSVYFAQQAEHAKCKDVCERMH